MFVRLLLKIKQLQPRLILGGLSLLVVSGLLVNYFFALSLTGIRVNLWAQAQDVLFSLGVVDLKNASLETIAKVALPDASEAVRPIEINGQKVRLSLDDANINLIMAQDPFPPNGSSSFPPYGPADTPPGLSSEQTALYNRLMYGSQEQGFQDAVGGCLYCNAPGGAGGCFKKRVIRGLTYSMVKQGYSEKEIIDELRLWQKFFFPGLAVKWTKYYAQRGVGPDEIPIDVKTFSLQGKRRVEAALAGQDFPQVPDQVGGCFRG
jgi:hypothetical protein